MLHLTFKLFAPCTIPMSLYFSLFIWEQCAIRLSLEGLEDGRHKKYAFRVLFMNFMACLWNQAYKIVCPYTFTPFCTLHFCKVFTVQKQRNNNVWLPFWKQQQVLSDECYLYGEFRLTGVRGKIDITCRKPECHPQRCLLARQQWVPAAWKSLSSLIANPGQPKAKT